MMQKYLWGSIENKKVDGDYGKVECVLKFLIIYLKIFQNINIMSKFNIFSQLVPWKLLMNEFCGTPCI